MNQSYSDQPTDQDELGITGAVEALAAIVSDPLVDSTPLTIGIYGAWGSGKTSTMLMLQRKLDAADQSSATCLPIWFDAWRYTQTDVLWRALLVSIIEQIEDKIVNNDDRLKMLLTRRAQKAGQPTISNDEVTAERKKLQDKLADLLASLYRSVEREESGAITFDWEEASKAVAGTALRIGIASLPIVGNVAKVVEETLKTVQSESAKSVDLSAFAAAVKREKETIYRQHVQSLEQFFQGFAELLHEWVIPAGFRLIVFIDDLDRCLPDQAVNVLEALKIFLDVRGCGFVLGMDRAIIEQGIRVHYQAFALAGETTGEGIPVESRDYMEKIIQLPFEIPPVDEAALSRYLLSRLDGSDEQGQRRYNLSSDQAHHVVEVITIGIERNPRKLKRAYNLFRLIWQLTRISQQSVEPVLIAKLIVIQISYGEVYNYIIGDSRRLVWLEYYAREKKHHSGLDASSQGTIEKLYNRHPRLQDMLGNEQFDGFKALIEKAADGTETFTNLDDLLLRSQRIAAR
jgi:predicted KAP-like P-loop ATPase